MGSKKRRTFGVTGRNVPRKPGGPGVAHVFAAASALVVVLVLAVVLVALNAPAPLSSDAPVTTAVSAEQAPDQDTAEEGAAEQGRPSPYEFAHSPDTAQLQSENSEQAQLPSAIAQDAGQSWQVPPEDEGVAYVAGEVVVQFGEGASAESVNAAIAALPCIADHAVSQAEIQAGYALLPVAEGYSVADALAMVDEVDDVIGPQPNYLYYVAEGAGDGNAASASGFAAGSIDFEALQAQADDDAGEDGLDVNDPYGKRAAPYNRNWHLESIDAYGAWKVVRGEQNNPCVTVAVVDSGCNLEHEDLKDNIVAYYDATTNQAEKFNAGMADTLGHGTHVAGIVASTANNEKGTAGVSYNAKIIPIQIFHPEVKNGATTYSATSVTLKAAYDYVLENQARYNIRVVNLSLGGEQTTTSEKDRLALQAIEEAYEKGVLTVSAANNKDDCSEPFKVYPASFIVHGLNVIALAQSGDDKVVRASYSNFNEDSTSYMDISAPGSNVWSTVSNGSYGSKSGTSMATPIVSGVAALVFTANPSLTPDDVMDIIHSTATDLTPENSGPETSVGFDAYTGYGEINAKAAVDSATVYLSGDSSVLKGGSTTLSLTGVAASGVSWSSSDPGIATVSQGGTVTGVSGGTVAITARIGGRSIVKTITVYDVSFSVVSYGTTSLGSGALEGCEMLPGDTMKLAFNENPDVGTWIISTSDASVASARLLGDGTVEVTARSAGKAHITATLRENANLVVSFEVSVAGKNNKARLDSAQATVTWPFLDSSGRQTTTYYYTGSPVKPVPSKVTYSVKVGDAFAPATTLKRGTDYTVSYSNNVKAGAAIATVSGTGSYAGSVTQRFTIARTPLTHVKLSVTVPAVTYTGKPVKPVPTLKLTIDGTYTLRQGVDFRVVSYSNNVKAGIGSVTLEGIGNFTGRRTVNFTISPARQPLYRLYNPYSGEHHYTLDANEKNVLVRSYGWRYEGVAWNCPSTSSTPVYRLYNPGIGLHHYTTDANEKNVLVRRYGWKYEGIAWYSAGKDGTLLYRLYNPYSGHHHYTADLNEKNVLSSRYGWRYEGIAWYGMK